MCSYYTTTMQNNKNTFDGCFYCKKKIQIVSIFYLDGAGGNLPTNAFLLLEERRPCAPNGALGQIRCASRASRLFTMARAFLKFSTPS